MKLSLAWIFDHIDADWKQQSVEHLVKVFNQVTAEIEHYEHVVYDLAPYALAQVHTVSASEVEVMVPEWRITVRLPLRDDLVTTSYQLATGEVVAFMVRKDANNSIVWATYNDFNSEKTGPLPAFCVLEDAVQGGWRSSFEAEDVILEVDNKSLTHRPDMWGHRGFAREIAAFLDLPLLPQEQFLTQLSCTVTQKQSAPTAGMPFTLVNDAPRGVHRFAGLYCEQVHTKPSNLRMASRLIKVGSRSIDALVDITNYVMLDWSQPMHAFDAAKVEGKKVITRFADTGEKLALLDGTTISLTTKDMVVANAKVPMALAGIMGGKNDSVNAATRSIFVESANFEAEIVRRSALHHKLRTEGSARFEKKLDPNQNTTALERFVFLAHELGVVRDEVGPIVCLGSEREPLTIEVSAAYLHARAGFAMTDDDVVAPLTKIGFEVHVQPGHFTITVPTFRSTKDVLDKEDILEEVVRFYGFNNIEPQLPHRAQTAFDISLVMRLRALKTMLQTSAHMTEQCNYSLFDEGFLATIGWQPAENSLAIVNPISSQAYRLVTSLIPGLLKNVAEIYVHTERLAFFEVGRVWGVHNGDVSETKKLAGIFFHKREALDFYCGKQLLLDAYALFNKEVTWHKHEAARFPWMSDYQTASIKQGEMVVGYAGMVNPLLLAKLDVLPESSAFVFELDLESLLSPAQVMPKYKPLSKYQESSFDLSFMVPTQCTMAQLKTALSAADALVQSVTLLDFFEKEAWQNVRALTFRVVVGAHDRVLVHEEIEQVRARLIAVTQQFGVTLRS